MRNTSERKISALNLATSTFSILAAAALLAGVLSCKARVFNSKASDARGVTTAPASLPVPVGVDEKLLTNLAAPEDDPQNDVTQNSIVPLSGGKFFSTLLDANGKPLGEIDAAASPARKLWNVVDYEKILASANKADSKIQAPGPFAGASVLNILVKNRKAFARKIEGGLDNVPGVLGERALFESPPVSLSVVYYEISDPAKPFETTSCKPFDPSDYGDVRWHYYCQIPAVFRACQRVLVGHFYAKNQDGLMRKRLDGKFTSEQLASAVNRLRREDEEAVRSYCLGPAGFADADTKNIYETIMRSNESAFGLAQGSLARIFQVFHASQVDQATGVNMYDYIMRSGLYAWDFTQQQAVLNTFYGSLKPTGEKAFDPKDPADCATYREARSTTEALLKKTGTQCLASEPRATPYYVAPVGVR